MAQNSPEPRSATGMPLLTGRPSGSPVMLMTPLIACAMRSYPGRSAYGPVCPKPEILAYTSGVERGERVVVDAERAATPGRQFSTTTSADPHEPVELRQALGGLEVERDAALVAVQSQEARLSSPFPERPQDRRVWSPARDARP